MDAIRNMADRWPSSLVARTEIERFSGGIMSERYLANLDAQGKGPEGRIRIGRKIAYPVEELIRFFESRAKVVPKKNGGLDE
jgi:hypothetical protein